MSHPFVHSHSGGSQNCHSGCPRWELDSPTEAQVEAALVEMRTSDLDGRALVRRMLAAAAPRPESDLAERLAVLRSLADDVPTLTIFGIQAAPFLRELAAVLDLATPADTGHTPTEAEVLIPRSLLAGLVDETDYDKSVSLHTQAQVILGRLPAPASATETEDGDDRG